MPLRCAGVVPTWVPGVPGYLFEAELEFLPGIPYPVQLNSGVWTQRLRVGEYPGTRVHVPGVNTGYPGSEAASGCGTKNGTYLELQSHFRISPVSLDSRW
eukprot:3481998-Rhodomonas_salina.1